MNACLWRRRLSMKKIIVPFVFLGVLFFSCTNGMVDSRNINENYSGKIYLASSGLSDYTQRSVSSIGFQTTGNPNAVPEVFVVKGCDAAILSEQEVVLAVKTCLEGKTLVIDCPTAKQLDAFKDRIDAVLSIPAEDGEESEFKYEYLKDQSDISPNSIYEIIPEKVSDGLACTESDSAILANSTNYGAIALRQGQIYFVHDINDALSLDSANVKADCSRVVENSIKNFVEWIKNPEAEEERTLSGKESAINALRSVTSEAALESAKKAQSAVHNFTATFTTNERTHYDGRYEGRAENVQIYIDVWSACDIAAQKEWYLVKTSVVCNNQQLNNVTEWSDKYVSPYFEKCSIKSYVNGATVDASKCSPQNSAGSTNFTSGSGFSIGANAGLNSSGPSAGLSVGYSVSQSSSRSIPDISVKFEPAADQHSAKWSFTAPKVEGYWDGLVSKCNGAKSIQTNAVTFDTYTIYTRPSNFAPKYKTIELTTTVNVNLEMLTSWIGGLGRLTSRWYDRSTGWIYFDYIKKPSNLVGEYIMSFSAPEGTTPERYELLNKALRDYIDDWETNVKYYTFGDITSPNGPLDKVAKSYFSGPKQKITTNKDVLKDRGFSGKYTFYIRNVSTGKNVTSFDVTF